MKNIRKPRAFTLIELLVVISILGILMGIVGPKVIDLLTGSEKTKMQAIFRGWVSQLHQYRSHYGYFPPFLLEEEEGIPVELKENEVHEDFIISLKGKKWSVGTGEWESTDGSVQNPQEREFHSFSDDEFGVNGKLVGSQNVKILIDQNGDGIIELDGSTVEQIIDSLSLDFSSAELQKIDRKLFSKVHEKVIIFLLEDNDLGINNVFSWNLEKYFE